MAYSEWPRGRWLIAYNGDFRTFKTKRQAIVWINAVLDFIRKEIAEAKKRRRVVQVLWPRVNVNAILVRVGTTTAYRGRLFGGAEKGPMQWYRVRPLESPRPKPNKVVISPRMWDTIREMWVPERSRKTVSRGRKKKA